MMPFWQSFPKIQTYETTCQLGTTFKSIFPCQHMYQKNSIHSKTWDFIQPIYILKLINILKMFCVKMTLLKSESPFCKLPHELIGLHEPLQWLVINHQNECATKQMTSKCM